MEMRIALRNAGRIDPMSIEDYVRAGGYSALEKARKMVPNHLIAEVERSGKLRGRGGAGFSTGMKWRAAAEAPGDEKYVICNADEGEPGTYKDRVIMESDPHTVLEGILICAHAVGARDAFIYCRGEYRRSIDCLHEAVRQAEEAGWTGEVHLHIAPGAGSYVCGEETALIESLEGKRGEPRLKPPFPTVSGYRGKPTVVNNVETFAAIPVIVEKGAAWFGSIGMADYPGTKIFALSGDVVNQTYFEVPTNTTMRDIIYNLGGGIPDGRTLKAVQVGGSSCSFMTEDMLDTPVDFESMRRRGVALGSGAVLVIDDSHNIVDILVRIADFFAHESCGKCTACREGTMRMQELLTRLANGSGFKRDLEQIRKLASYMEQSCFCPLGKSATTAVSSALQLFPDDFTSRLKKEEA